VRARLLEAIAKARLWLDGLIAGRFTSTAEIARHERCSERAVRITLSLAFLAPAIVRTAVEGRLPYGLIASSFSELPILWAFAREVDGSIPTWSTSLKSL
jgi:site-specific DNA recombinase